MTLSDRTRPNQDNTGNNTSGLAVFPDELLLEIVSYFQYPPLTGPSTAASVPLTIRFERRETLSALSETCQNLRQVVRPYLWERIEVGGGMRVGKFERHIILRHGQSEQIMRDFSKEILRQLEATTVLDP